MDSEMEMQRKGDTDRATGGETREESYAHVQRWSETDKTRDIEGKTTETNGLSYAVPRPTQHKGQLEAALLPEEPLLSSAPSVSAVGLIILAEVFTAALSTISERFKFLQ